MSLKRLAGLISALSLVAACGNSTAADESKRSLDTPVVSTSTSVPIDKEEIVIGGEIVVGLEGETATFLPGAGTFAPSGTQIAYTIFDPIAVRGADGQVHPFAAESIEPNAEATEWTVKLRSNLTFHDGAELNAETMRQIFDEYLTAEGATTAGSLAQVVEFRVDDDLEFTYVLEKPNAAFADLLTGSIGWPFSVEACRAAGDDCGSKPVGTGPFQFVSWSRDHELVVERNPDYWRADEYGNQLPYLDRVTFRPLADQSTRLMSVEAGTTQAGFTFLADYIRQARDSNGVDSHEAIGNEGIVTVLNTMVPPLDDQRVRQALHMAADQNSAIALLGGTGIVPPHTQMYGSDSGWYSKAAEEAWAPYDPEAARSLIQQYVNDPERSDKKNPGDPLTLTYQAPADPMLQSVAQFYQGAWNDIGVTVTVASVEQAILISNVIGTGDTDPPFRGNYEASIFRAGSQDDPYTVLRSAFGDPASVPGNLTNYWSEAIAENIEKLGTSTNFNERYLASEAIMVELAEQVPMIWAGAAPTSIYTSTDLRNVAGWTIPGSDPAESIPGGGVTNAVTFWSQVWLDR